MLFRSREVVLFRHIPGLFGSRPDSKERMRYLTINNGVLNQCSMNSVVTPYWSVVDAMSSLKSDFTRDDVINLSVEIVGESYRSACGMAWDVLRNHHRHARKRHSGLCYMVEPCSGGKLFLRARNSDETVQYFENEAIRRKTSNMILSSFKKIRSVGLAHEGVDL